MLRAAPLGGKAPALHGLRYDPVVEDAFSRLYAQLRALARRRMRGERAGHTLGATALVHEAIARVGAAEPASDAARARYYRAAADEMRRVLVDHARRRARLKRGGGARRLDLDETLAAAEVEPEEFLAVDEAVRRLERTDARAGEVVRLRFFAGLDVASVARALGVAERTVEREWAYARAWLRRALRTETSRP